MAEEISEIVIHPALAAWGRASAVQTKEGLSQRLLLDGDSDHGSPPEAEKLRHRSLSSMNDISKK